MVIPTKEGSERLGKFPSAKQFISKRCENLTQVVQLQAVGSLFFFFKSNGPSDDTTHIITVQVTIFCTHVKGWPCSS